MYYICLLSATFIVTLPSIIFATNSLQFKLANKIKKGRGLEKIPELFEMDNNMLTQAATSHRIRKALRSLLKLNDKDLNAAFQDTSQLEERNHVSPISALFHIASQNNLQRLKNLISAEDWDDPESSGTKIEKDYSTTSSKFDTIKYDMPDVEEDSETLVGYDDKSLMEELDQLSAYLDKETKNKGRGSMPSNKRKRHSHNYARKEAYYHYWLKSGTCPKSAEGLERVHCPTASKTGEWVCVDDQELCDGYSHCPNDEDENPKACLFYKTVHNYLEFFSTAVLTAIRRH